MIILYVDVHNKVCLFFSNESWYCIVYNRCGENLWNNTSVSCEPEKACKGSEVDAKGGDQYTQLRNEWTQEAEELLSDISQHLYLANYMDTQPPKVFTLHQPLYFSVNL